MKLNITIHLTIETTDKDMCNNERLVAQYLESELLYTLPNPSWHIDVDNIDIEVVSK